MLASVLALILLPSFTCSVEQSELMAPFPESTRAELQEIMESFRGVAQARCKPLHLSAFEFSRIKKERLISKKRGQVTRSH